MEKTVTIELLLVKGCQSRQSTMEMVEKAVAAKGVNATIKQTFVDSLEQARQLKFLGSPSIRINGIDIEPEAAGHTDYATG